MHTVSRFRFARRHSSSAWLFSSLALVLMLLAGCVPIQPTASNMAAPAALTLRFAIPDEAGRPQIDPYVNEFVAQAHALSQGQITIEPTWDGGSGLRSPVMHKSRPLRKRHNPSLTTWPKTHSTPS